MSKVEVYSKGYCPFCVHAKALLREKGVDFQEYEIDVNPELRPQMIERAKGRSTVPQIFINDVHVGGCDDLMALERHNKLDDLLQG
mgnify:CR=1 FL=1|tara:strand:+ start:267 stop:524 length:258 start_codon:yes stop_codon:yes gene_type:complete